MSPEDESKSVFDDRDAFAASHRPDRFEYRDEEITTLRSVLSPAIASGGTASALVCGPAATGKRTAVAITVETVQSRTAGADLRFVPVECPIDATAYKLSIATTNALLDEDALAESGYTRETAFRRLRGQIRDTDGTPVLRFDRVQRADPMEFEKLLAGLFDATGDLPCAVVAVADGLAYRNELAVETRRRLDGVLYFSPYDHAQRHSIVDDRVTAAFCPGACPDDVVARCLSYAETTDAPVRRAFEVLRRAGDEATTAGVATLRLAHVDQAISAVERDRLAETLEGCSPHERRTFAALASVGDGRFESIYEAYRQRCREQDVSPNRKRSVHNYLDALVEADLVEATERRSAVGGRYFEYSVVPDVDLAEASLAAIDGGDSGATE